MHAPEQATRDTTSVRKHVPKHEVVANTQGLEVLPSLWTTCHEDTHVMLMAADALLLPTTLALHADDDGITEMAVMLV
jgi:hypothetical protein